MSKNVRKKVVTTGGDASRKPLTREMSVTRETNVDREVRVDDKEPSDTVDNADAALTPAEKLYQSDAQIYKQKQKQEIDKHKQLNQYDHQRKTTDETKPGELPQQKLPQQQQQAQPQQQQHSHKVDSVKNKWQQQVGAAKAVWSQLSYEELLKTNGQVQQLARLLQARCDLTPADADMQAKAFIEKCSLN